MNDGAVIGIVLFVVVLVIAFVVSFIPAPNATDISEVPCETCCERYTSTHTCDCPDFCPCDQAHPPEESTA